MAESLWRVAQLLARFAYFLQEHRQMIAEAKSVLKHGHCFLKYLRSYAPARVRASISQNVHMEKAPSSPPTPTKTSAIGGIKVIKQLTIIAA